MTTPTSGTIGLDIGATKTLGVLVDAEGHVVKQVREATEPGPDGVVRTARLVVADLAAATDGAPVTSIGLGIPGLVDVERGAVKHAVNLGVDGDWVPLRAELEERLGVRVVVEWGWPGRRTDDLPTLEARGWSQPGARAVIEVLRKAGWDR